MIPTTGLDTIEWEFRPVGDMLEQVPEDPFHVDG